MTKEIFDGYKYIEGGVCAAKGFVANGLNCGINPVKEKFDLGVVYSETECNAAGVYTQNKVKGAPIIVTKKHLEKSGGKAKGSGMIHPNMATTLNFVTTDVAVTTEMVQKALSDIVKVTYNCLSIDGDTSTNDMVSVMANGLAGNKEIAAEGDDYDKFKQALYIVMSNMTKMLASDGEGASKLLECTCEGAPDIETAIIVAKSVIRSPLFKCAMFGEDANWGRILCAIGYAEADFDIAKVSVSLRSEVGSVKVCENGAGVEFSEDEAAKILAKDEIFIDIDLGQGDVSAKAWGCDLTYDYVKINGDYRS